MINDHIQQILDAGMTDLSDANTKVAVTLQEVVDHDDYIRATSHVLRHSQPDDQTRQRQLALLESYALRTQLVGELLEEVRAVQLLANHLFGMPDRLRRGLRREDDQM